MCHARDRGGLARPQCQILFKTPVVPAVARLGFWVQGSGLAAQVLAFVDFSDGRKNGSGNVTAEPNATPFRASLMLCEAGFLRRQQAQLVESSSR